MTAIAKAIPDDLCNGDTMRHLFDAVKGYVNDGKSLWELPFGKEPKSVLDKIAEYLTDAKAHYAVEVLLTKPVGHRERITEDNKAQDLSEPCSLTSAPTMPLLDPQVSQAQSSALKRRRSESDGESEPARRRHASQSPDSFDRFPSTGDLELQTVSHSPNGNLSLSTDGSLGRMRASAGVDTATITTTFYPMDGRQVQVHSKDPTTLFDIYLKSFSETPVERLSTVSPESVSEHPRRFRSQCRHFRI